MCELNFAVRSGAVLKPVSEKSFTCEKEILNVDLTLNDRSRCTSRVRKVARRITHVQTCAKWCLIWDRVVNPGCDTRGGQDGVGQGWWGGAGWGGAGWGGAGQDGVESGGMVQGRVGQGRVGWGKVGW